MKSVSDAIDKAYQNYLENKDETAFYQAIYKFARGHFIDVLDEDAIQEAVIQVWKGLPSFKGTAKFSTWISRVVGHAMQYEMRRRRSNETSLDEILESGGEHTLGERPHPEKSILVDTALERLSPKQQETVQMLREGWTERDIAEQLGVSRSTIHERWEGALETLRSKK